MFMLSQIQLPFNKPIRSSKNIFSFAEDIDVITSIGMKAIEAAGLKGLDFRAFDVGGKYFAFSPRTTLETQSFPDNEYEGDHRSPSCYSDSRSNIYTER